MNFADDTESALVFAASLVNTAQEALNSCLIRRS